MRAILLAGVLLWVGWLLSTGGDAHAGAQGVAGGTTTARDTTQCAVTCHPYNLVHADAGMAPVACGTAGLAVRLVVREADKATGVYVCDDGVAIADILTKCVLVATTSANGPTWALNNTAVYKSDGTTPVHRCAGAGVADAGMVGLVETVAR